MILSRLSHLEGQTFKEHDPHSYLVNYCNLPALYHPLRPLGPLQYLRIWHDNSGKGKKASWFFSYMVVRDIQTGEEFQFIYNGWLAVEEGDGQVGG